MTRTWRGIMQGLAAVCCFSVVWLVLAGQEPAWAGAVILMGGAAALWLLERMPR